MPLSPIAFIAPNYRDFKNYWLKAYEPGTPTPKIMALDDQGAVTVAKLELNKDGFLKSAGGALVIPYLNGAYDLWLFPTEAEADANNTSNAERVADNILGVLADDAIETLLINDLSQAYTFKTVALMQASLIVFPVGKKIFWQGYHAESDGGSNWGLVKAGAGINDGGSEFTLADGRHVAANLKGQRISANKFGAQDGADSTSAIQAALDLGSFPLPADATNVTLNSGTYITSANLVVGIRQSFGGKSNNQFAVVIKPTIAVTKAIDFQGGGDIKHLTLNMVDTLNATGLHADKGTLSIGNVMVVEDVLIENCLGTGWGIEIKEVVGIDFTNVRVVDCDTGMRILGDTGSLPTYISFTNCAFRSGGRGVIINRGYGITFTNCLFEDNEFEAVRIDVLDRVERVLFSNCWFERNFQSSATDYNVVVDGTNPGAIAEDITFNYNFFYESSVSKTAHFIKVKDVRWNGNTHQSAAGTVLFDGGTAGWVSEQPDNFANGALVNAGGSIVEELASSVNDVWTATLVSSGNITGTPTFTSGTYVKTGNQVTLWGAWEVDVVAAGVSTFVQMSGIPFNTSAPISNHIGVCNLSANEYSAGIVNDPSAGNSDRILAGIAAPIVVTNGMQTLYFTMTYETN